MEYKTGLRLQYQRHIAGVSITPVIITNTLQSKVYVWT